MDSNVPSVSTRVRLPQCVTIFEFCIHGGNIAYPWKRYDLCTHKSKFTMCDSKNDIKVCQGLCIGLSTWVRLLCGLHWWHYAYMRVKEPSWLCNTSPKTL